MNNDMIEKLFPKAIEVLKKTQQPTAEERISALEAAVADLALQNLPVGVKTDA